MHLEEPPKLIQPREHKAKVSIWADLTVSDMDIIDDATTPDEIKMELANIFEIEDYKDNLKNGILVDLYYYTIQFARDNSFTKEQTSAFFSILKKTHEVCIETPFGNVEQTFSYFREMVLCHAVKRPPFSIDLFTPEDVKKITEYVINTYFRHIKMYKYAFTPLVRLDLSMQYSGMPETPEPSEAGDETARTEGESEGKEGEGQEGEAQEGEAKEAEEQPAAEPVMPEPSKKKSEKPNVVAGGHKTRRHRVRFEESPAAKELRKLIKQHLSEEMGKLKVEVEQQIKESEDTLNQKLSQVEPKGGRGSGKGKKK